MTNPDNRVRRWLFGGVSLLVVCIVALLTVACAGQGPSQPAPTESAAQPATAVATTVAATQAPSDAATQPAKPLADLPVGADEQGNFYRGDPNAPVTIEDFSDFQ